ncbi:MAG: NrdJb [Steroidobacteraceae bacterium]
MTTQINKRITKYRVRKPEDAAATAALAAVPEADMSTHRDGHRSKVVQLHEKIERPEMLIGSTYKIKTPVTDHAMYVTINDILLNEDTDHERRQPFEIFINSKNLDHFQWIVALTRIISAVFRKGGDVTFMVDELKAVFDPRGGQWQSGHYVPSLLAAIGEVIERHLIAIGFMAPREGPLMGEEIRAVAVAAEGAPARFCPRCGSASFVKLEGCDTCVSCGYSKCS